MSPTIKMEIQPGGTQPPSAPEVLLKPTLFIGLGGTGLKILARFRRRLYEKFGNADHWPIYKFLGVDSNEDELRLGGEEGGSGTPVERRDCLAVGLKAEEVKKILDEQTTFQSHVGLWLPPDVLHLGYVGFTDGAGQMRSVGRLLFLKQLAAFRKAVTERCSEAQSPNAIKRAMANGASLATESIPNVDVVIVTSLAGGTGAGCFLDCAYFLRHLAQKGEARIGDIRGMFLLPDNFEAVLDGPKKKTAFANGYAALKELEYFNGFLRHPFPTDAWGDASDGKPIGEVPFQVTYLFSRSNGAPLEKIDEMYDLVADGLAFSMSGTTLASHMRGAWSNAKRASYLGSLSYALPAQSADDGGVDPDSGDDNRRYLTYEKKWSTRYSSLGISSVTMKIPELTRLAGIYLLRRLLLWEVGEDRKDEGAGAELDRTTTAKQVTQDIRSPKSFVDDLRREITKRVEKCIAASSARQASEDFARQVALLRELASCVNTPDAARGLTQGNAKELRNRVMNQAEQHAALLAPPGQRSRLRDRQALLRRAVELIVQTKDNLQQGSGTTTAESAFDADSEVSGLTQWSDLDEHGVGDEWGLGTRAMKIVRSRVRNSMASVAKAEVDRINARLTWMYFEKVIAITREAQVRLETQVSAVAPWIEALKRMSEPLMKHFEQSRNEVVTREYVRNEPNLEKEVEQALEASHLALTDKDFETLQDRILDELGRRFQLGQQRPTTFGETRTVVGQRFDRTLETLVDITSEQFGGNLPRERDIFRILAGREETASNVVTNLQIRARAYWPITLADLGSTAHNHWLAGAIEPTNPLLIQQQIIEELGQKGAQWLPSGASAPGAPVGELILVHEAHGYSILSLGNLNLYREAYESRRQEGDVANRHLDKRLYRALPELVPSEASVAIAEIENSDLGMVGILLRLFSWNPKTNSFRVKVEGDRNVDLGMDYTAIARWLASGEGRPYRETIRRKLDGWFATRRGERDPEKARLYADEIQVLDLCIEKLMQHVYSRDGDQRSGPDHTMLRRLKRHRIRPAFEHLYAVHDDLKSYVEDQRRQLALDLHRRTEFVGPAVPQDGRGLYRPQRVLVPLEGGKTAPKDGLDVRKEALELGWFPEKMVVEEVTTLCPEFASEGGEDTWGRVTSGEG